MGPFVRGVLMTILVVFAAIGAVSLAGVDIGVRIDTAASGPDGPESTAAETPEPVPESTNTATEEPESGFDNAAVREQFRQRLNQFRENHGRTALTHQTALCEAAKFHSDDMADRNYFAHESPDGSDFTDRVRRAGGSCQRGGENIAQTWWAHQLESGPGPEFIDSENDLAAALFMQWRESAGHREIMLTRGVTGMGIGVTRDESGEIYATLVVC